MSHLLVVNPNTNRVYLPVQNKTTGVTHSPGGLITLDGSTMQVTGPALGAGRQFVSVAINSVTNKIYAVEGSPGNAVVVLR